MSRVKPAKKIEYFPLVEDGFQLITDNNFSYESVPLGKTLRIYPNMQMIVHDVSEFDIEGVLLLEGSLVLED